jgi:hydrogenase nickel incorporation protein HypA/HybF
MEICLRHADGRRIRRVELEVGTLRQVVPSALSFSFEVMAQGTVAEGAQVDIEVVPAVGKCRRCGETSELPSFPLQCAGCGGFDLEIIDGQQMTVASLELEDARNGEA